MSEGKAQVPRVTVLLPVRDGRAYLADAIESILAQTLRDLELLVMDDGSRDGSDRIAEGRGDPRIRLVRNARPLGLVATLNRGLELARGEIVARMDADDESLPERLERQVAFLDAHPEIGACGSWIVATGGADAFVRAFPTRPDDVRCELLFGSALAHPTVCLRRAWFAQHGLRFEAAYPHAEDYQLWRRASAVFPLANLDAPLLRYRKHAGSVSRRFADDQHATVVRIHAEALAELGIDASPSELRIHRAAAWPAEGGATLAEIEAWLLALRRANAARPRYPTAAFERCVSERWRRAMLWAVSRGEPVVARLLRSPLSRRIPPAAGLRLLGRAALRGARRAAASG